MHALVLARLRRDEAELRLKAVGLRTEWRTMPATTNRALMLGKQAKEYEEQADDYLRLIAWAEDEG